MSFFQNLFQGFMGLPHFWIILILSLIATFVTTIIYKFATDQKRIKEIKSKLKSFKETQKKYKNDTNKLMSIQKEMMELNMEMMKQSFKSMIYTFIPLILLFTWMAANIAYEPIHPGDEFTLTARISNSYFHELNKIEVTLLPEGNVTFNDAYMPSKESRREIQWVLVAPKPGMYTAIVSSPTFNESKEILISDGKDYVNPVKDISRSQLMRLEVGNKIVRPFGNFGIFGIKLNWLWTYILISVLSSMGFRKLMKVA